MSVRLGGALKELRIHLCQTSKSSQGVRDFIQKNYVDLKKENPNFPILIRECNGIQPTVWVRFAKGCETCYALTDMSKEQVQSLFNGIFK